LNNLKYVIVLLCTLSDFAWGGYRSNGSVCLPTKKAACTAAANKDVDDANTFIPDCHWWVTRAEVSGNTCIYEDMRAAGSSCRYNAPPEYLGAPSGLNFNIEACTSPLDALAQAPQVPKEKQCTPGMEVSNPIIPSSGIKVQRETDYSSLGAQPIEWTRVYRSAWIPASATETLAAPAAHLGAGWIHPYSTRLVFEEDRITVLMGDGLGVKFVKDQSSAGVGYSAGGGACRPSKEAACAAGAQKDVNDAIAAYPGCTWTVTRAEVSGNTCIYENIRSNGSSCGYNSPPNYLGAPSGANYGIGSCTLAPTLENTSWITSGSTDTLSIVLGPAGAATGYRYLSGDGTAMAFDIEGKLQTITLRNGWTTSLTYSSTATPVTIAPAPGLLIGVSNQFGRSVSLAYNSASDLVSVSTPVGSIGYVYDTQNRLVQATGTDGTTRQYLYENASFPYALTGLVDENGARFASWAYDAQGRAISGEHAGATEKYQISYPAQVGSSATVTDPLGTARTYSYTANQGQLEVTGATLPLFGAARDAASRVQDANGLVTQETDFLGVNTMYTWDINRRLPLATTRAASLPEAQTTTTQWHATFRLPVLVTEAGRTTAYTYDAQGNRLSQTVTDTATGVARTTSWTYNPQGLVATESINGIVRQTYAYYTATSFSGTAPNEVGHTAGDLQSITNAVGHVTQFTLYDRAGRARQMVDPKGVATDTVYTPKGWVSSVAVAPPGGTARTTTYSYDNAGHLIGVVMPDTTTMSYSYDAAHRLTGVTDAKGNTITYTLDAMGNKTGEQVKDPAGNLQRNITRVYDALNRVQQVTGASN